MPNILDRIVDDTRDLVAWRKHEMPERALRARLPEAPPVRDFARALRRVQGSGFRVQGATIKVIAEVKRASPSAGVIREDVDPAVVARSYAAHGAAAISVLTEPNYFKGSLADLSAARAVAPVPVLRKDFIIDPYQLLEARVAGADAALLIAAVLDDDRLRHLLANAAMLGLQCLVEVHSQAELERVLATDARVIGINNRDLGTFTVDLATTERLVSANDLAGRVIVSESGIKTAADIARLARAGVDAVLVGETLMRAPDPGIALSQLLGV